MLLPENHRDITNLPRPIVACDFDAVIDGATVHARGRMKYFGSELPGVMNMDHHAQLDRFYSLTNTSTVMAAAYARFNPRPLGAEWTVCINHTDCDSVLSSTIVAGLLPCDDRLVRSSIAADHTGAEDEVADLLQALDPWRDLDRSFANLRSLLDGAPLEAEAQRLLDERRRHRDLARRAADNARGTVEDGVAFGVLTERIEGEFFTALLPEAEVILLTFPKAEHVTGEWVMRLRLGTPKRIRTLFDLRMEEFDPGMRGRWNAMANRRTGGTTIDPAVYAAEVRRRLAEARPGEPSRPT